MPRQARIDFEGALQHVIGRSIQDTAIFKDREDKQNFRDRIINILERSSLQCYAWAIMDNHFHLLLQTGSTPLADFMRKLLTGYSVYYNKKHARIGHVFYNRYKSILCDKDAYLLTLIRYINLNPVKAGMVNIEKLSGYEWGSHREMISSKDCIVARDEVLSFFGEKEKEALLGYSKFIVEGVGLDEDYDGGGLKRSAGGLNALLARKLDAKEMYDERVLGNGDFVNEVLRLTEEKENFKRKTKVISLESLQSKICAYYKISEQEFQRGRMAHVTKAKKFFVYIANIYLEKTKVEIAKFIGVQPVSLTRLMASMMLIEKRDLECMEILGD